MKKISKLSYMKHRKELMALERMGKKYDKETDPEKKEILREKVIAMCEDLKGKLDLQDISDEEAQRLLGVPVNSSSDNNKIVTEV